MDVRDIIKPKRETSFEYGEDDKKEEFIIREPTPDEMNMCDLLRSKIWYDCMRKGIPTQEEILSMLKEQGRFSEEKYLEKYAILEEDVSESLGKMALCDSLDELKEAYKVASSKRELLTKHRMKKNSFIRHSVEVRADHSYNMALMGLCVEKRNGKSVFVQYDEIGNVDIDKTFSATESWEDVGFINTAITHFMPFLMGYSNNEDKNAEDYIYDTIALRFKKDEVEDEREEAESSDNTESKLEELKVKNIEEKAKQETVTVTETVKTPEPEIEVEVPKSKVIESDPLDVQLDSFSSTVTLDEKPELIKANNRPHMTPAPTQERMTVRPNQKAQDEVEDVDSTAEKSGFRTGDEDADYGDGSARPGGQPIRTILKR